jgi:choline dehydrogenase-like flavoprotein
MPLPRYDVLIIGSGAAGGTAAWTLTQKGANCLLLDAGPLVDFDRVRTARAVYDLPYRGFGKPGRLAHVTQSNEFNANQWADETENPYTTAAGSPYNWVRVRMVGGKSLFWARLCFRLSDYELKCRRHDGFGEDWPIGYADLKPYYDRVEPVLRVSGRKEGYPQLPDGIYLEDDSPWSGAMQRIIAAANRRNMPLTKVRRALGQGQFASPFNLLLPEAYDTGNLTIVPNAVVRSIAHDERTGLATGAHFVDRRSGREMTAKARVVVLAASCLESTRILLNSHIANSSGVLGRYLHDQFYIKQCVQSVLTDAKNGKATRTFMGGGGYIPRFVNLKRGKEESFIRGYAIQIGTGGTPDSDCIPAYGAELERLLDQYRGAGVHATIMGEVLPRYENRVTVDPAVKDAWGIPALHIDARYTDNETKMAKHAEDTTVQLFRDAGCEIVASHSQPVPPGESIHELGTCRMGNDPKKSVLNKWNQCHDVKNLFVVDGSSFVSGGYQNPTITIMALSMRASEYMAEQMRAGAL